MNFGEMSTEVMDRLAVPAAGDGIITAARVARWINQALRAIADERDWWWLLYEQSPITFNNGVTNTPADLLHGRGLSINGYPIKQIAVSDYVGQQLIEDWPAPGFGWVVIGAQIKLAPAPAGVYQGIFVYHRAEANLVNPADVPYLPAAHHDALIEYAVYLAATSRQDIERAAQAQAAYQAWLKRMRDDISPRQGPKSIRMTGGTSNVSMANTFTPAPTPTFAGGLLLCTSLTRPVGVDGQWIYETDTRKVFEYDAVSGAWRVPWQIEWPDVYALSDVVAL